MAQISFGALAHLEKKKTTRREKMLNEMELTVPWGLIEDIIRPFYPKCGAGRQPIGLSKMLRIYCLQQWYQLSDPSMEEALYDMESMRRFAGIDLGSDVVPDETTILNFRHLLEANDLTAAIFAAVGGHLEEKGLLLRQGTIVDATIIAAPPSTKNQSRTRDPEMSSTKKGNQWHFGMKAHIGTDTGTGLVHTVVCTTAKVHDSQVMDDLMHGQESEVYGDKAYANQNSAAELAARGVKWKVSRKGTPKRQLGKRDKAWNRRQSRVRAKVEHAFGVVKNLWKYRKVRYRGIVKNAAQLYTLFALANLYLVRRQLLRAGRQIIRT